MLQMQLLFQIKGQPIKLNYVLMKLSQRRDAANECFCCHETERPLFGT